MIFETNENKFEKKYSLAIEKCPDPKALLEFTIVS
jgi:hypothetical protein